MGKYMRAVLGLFLGVLLLAATAQADERQANELRERANGLKEKIQRLQEEGKHDEAKQLEREVDELFAKADRVAREGPREQTPADALRQKLEGLYKEWTEATVGGRGDAAEELQRKIHDVARDVGARMQELIKPQLEMMERRIAELREQGKPELADRLTGQLREMIQAHRQAQVQQQREQPEGPRRDERWQQRINELERRLEELRQQGNQEQADRVAKELVQMRQRIEGANKRQEMEQREREQRERGPEGRPGPGPQDRAERERRMQHLRGAADNLNAIGMQDMAEKLRREAEEIQQSLEQPRPQGEGFPQGMMENIQNELRNLNQRLDEVNRRLEELMEIVRRDRR